MNKLKELIKLLDGKKTIIGAVLAFILFGAQGAGLIDQTTFDNLRSIVEVVLGVGLTHKLVKQM
jgi:hypothetical protein